MLPSGERISPGSGEDICRDLSLKKSPDPDSGSRVKAFLKAALLQGIAFYGCCAAILFGCMKAIECSAMDPPPGYLDVKVEDISYLGNNNYRIGITVFNQSDNTVVLEENRRNFYLQTEILGRWKELNSSHHTDTEHAVISPGKSRQEEHILQIPQNIPLLYRNNDGDMNMLFKYLIRFHPRSESVPKSVSGESSFWITPKTNAWILREGM